MLLSRRRLVLVRSLNAVAIASPTGPLGAGLLIALWHCLRSIPIHRTAMAAVKNAQAVRFSSKAEEIEPALSAQPALTMSSTDESLGQTESKMRHLAVSMQMSRCQAKRLENFSFEPVSLPCSRVSSRDRACRPFRCSFFSFLGHLPCAVAHAIRTVAIAITISVAVAGAVTASRKRAAGHHTLATAYPRRNQLGGGRGPRRKGAGAKPACRRRHGHARSVAATCFADGWRS